jgi:hypothetical protein
MKDFVAQIDMSNLRNLVKAVEKHFILVENHIEKGLSPRHTQRYNAGG